MFGVWNSHAGFGVFLPVLAREFHWSRGAISVAASLNLLVGGALALGVGAAGDRYGPRPVLLVSALVLGAVYMLASRLSALWHFYLLLGLLAGAGMSSMYIVPTATVSRWFAERRGLALGILLTGLNLAYVTGGPLSAYLISAVGWRKAYVVLGALVWLVVIPASLFTRLPPASRAPSGDGTPPAPGASAAAAAGVTIREGLGDRRLWLLAGSWALLGMAYMTVVIHIVPHIRDRGVTLEAASLALTIWGVSQIAGSLLFGFVADRLGTRLTFRVCLVMELVSLTAVLTGPPLWLLYLLIAGIGVGSGGTDTTIAKAASEIFGLRAIGAIIGIITLGWRVGAALGPPTAGFIYDATGSYSPAFGLASAALALGLVLFTLAASADRGHAH